MQLTRENVATNLKWDLSPMYKSDEAFDKHFEEVQKKFNFEKFKGQLNNKTTILEFLKEYYSVGGEIESLAVYASVTRDQNTKDGVANARYSKLESLFVQFSSSTAFMTPELTSLDESFLVELKNDSDMQDYSYMIKCIIDEKPHVLSQETEMALALGGQVFGSFQNIFAMMNNADLPFPEIDVNGEMVKVTHGMYGVLLQSEDRSVRERAFKSFYKAFESVLNTISATYISSVHKDVFLAKVKKYKGCLDKALSSEDVSVEVYNNLLESVNNALPSLHKYMLARKQELKLEEQHMYDIYTPLVENADIKVDYEEAFKIVKEGLKPLGEEYSALLQTAHDDRWIDVLETEGKRSGAYSIGVYTIPHPYVLLNYQKTTHDVFTLAHELGHSMHTYFSNKNQPQAKADYKIFVAEVASTVNEVLLLKHLLKTTTDVKLKKYLSSYFLDMVRTTCFRQTMFAEFEYLAHSKAENGEPLTKDNLSEIYLELNKKYYGEDIVSDREISFEWARIPHFYTPFYVYKYATGIISAISIAERILNEGQTAVKDYFAFLSSGGSSDPVSLLKLAGVDLTKKDAFESAFSAFDKTLEEFKSI